MQKSRGHIACIMGLRHFFAPKEAENLSGLAKETNAIKMPETLVSIHIEHTEGFEHDSLN